jgi:hypothetical protein
MQSQGQDQDALAQLVQKAKEGDEEALLFIKKMQEEMVPAQQDGGRVVKDKQEGADGNEYGLDVVYRGEGMPNDPEGRKVIADRQQAVASHKCGGKTKKKQLGGAVKTKKAGCGCLLKKVGGRLVEIDGCTGQIVKRK